MSEKPLQHLSCPVVVLKISVTEVRGDPLADALRSEMLAVYLQSSARHAVLDFSNVTYLASTGFRPLLSLNRLVRQRQGRLMLCGLNPNVAETFSVTRLIDVSGATKATFEAFPDVQSAIADLFRA
jgi:stage II sporulation protein AA (anti-sigma F factor antagonist)